MGNKFVKVITVGIIFIILQSFLQNNQGLMNIYSRYIGYLTPIIYAIFIAIFLEPIVNFFENKLKINRILGIIITIILIIIIIIGFVGIITPSLSKSIKELYLKLPMMQEKSELYIENIIMYLKSKGIIILGENELQKSAINFIKKNTSHFQDFGISALLNIVWWGLALTKFFIGFFLGTLIILNKEYFVKFLENILKLFFGDEKGIKILDFLEQTREILLKFVFGRILVSIAVGFITFITMAITSTPYALLTGVMMGVGNMIPYVGSIVGGLIAIFLVSLAMPSKLIFLFVATVLAQLVDGWIIGPRIVGKTIGMSTFWIMVAILIGGSMGGIFGMFFGVPIFAMIKLIYHNYLKKWEKK